MPSVTPGMWPYKPTLPIQIRRSIEPTILDGDDRTDAPERGQNTLSRLLGYLFGVAAAGLVVGKATR